jgi:hypothetical protein
VANTRFTRANVVSPEKTARVSWAIMTTQTPRW